MNSFDDFIGPVSSEAFFRDTYRKQPTVIAATDARKRIFGYDQFNALLAQSSVWTPSTLKVWIDKMAVPAARYCSTVMTMDGEEQRPDPQKIQAWLARGASVILNGAEALTPEIRAVAKALEDALFGYVVANAYFSFGGHQAFDSHYDDHEVFAVHIAGEKTWRVYEGRLDNPVGQPQQAPNAQRMHDQAKGRVAFERKLTPGELIYIPRGQYHDALATTDASLHVTFSVQPMNGLAVLDVLEKEAARESIFRDDLPTPGRGGLEDRLAELGDRLAAMARDPGFARRVLETQRLRKRPSGEFSLPRPPASERLATAIQNAGMARTPTGIAIVAGGRQVDISADELPVCQWIFAAADFSRGEAEAEFRRLDASEVGALLDRLIAAGILRRV